MLLPQSIEHVFIVSTRNTYFVMHWSMYLIREYLVSVLINYGKYVYESFALRKSLLFNIVAYFCLKLLMYSYTLTLSMN